MKTRNVFAVIVGSMVSLPALAQNLPQIPMPMRHITIDLDFNTQSVAVGEVFPETLDLLTYDETYDGPASVLNNTAYNDQYGWLPGSVFAPPTGTGIWFRLVDKTDGLNTYEGGMRPNRANYSYDLILDQPDDTWQWSGMMTHNFYAADELGSYSATYEVYVGDDVTGAPTAGWTPDTVTLNFNAVPEPTTLMLVVAGSALFLRRRSAIRLGR